VLVQSIELSSSALVTRRTHRLIVVGASRHSHFTAVQVSEEVQKHAAQVQEDLAKLPFVQWKPCNQRNAAADLAAAVLFSGTAASLSSTPNSRRSVTQRMAAAVDRAAPAGRLAEHVSAIQAHSAALRTRRRMGKKRQANGANAVTLDMLCAEQMDVVRAIKSGKNVFFTGCAGGLRGVWQ